MAAGLIERKHLYVNNRQQANEYRVLTGVKSGLPSTYVQPLSIPHHNISESWFPEEQNPIPSPQKDSQHGIPRLWELRDRYHNADWLVDHFGAHLAKRDGQVKRESYRRRSWVRPLSS